MEHPQGYGSQTSLKASLGVLPRQPLRRRRRERPLYDICGKAEWAANERLYRADPGKPYAVAEWGLGGIDDPAFVRRMGGWARTHRRLELPAWFESRAGAIFDLATKPGSRAAYRRQITPLG